MAIFVLRLPDDNGCFLGSLSSMKMWEGRLSEWVTYLNGEPQRRAGGVGQ